MRRWSTMRSRDARFRPGTDAMAVVHMLLAMFWGMGF